MLRPHRERFNINALKVLSTAVGLLVFSSIALASPMKGGNSFQPGSMAKGAPPELMHWGKLVGQWSTKEEGLKPDGYAWQASKGADWDFFWAYNG